MKSLKKADLCYFTHFGICFQNFLSYASKYYSRKLENAKYAKLWNFK